MSELVKDFYRKIKEDQSERVEFVPFDPKFIRKWAIENLPEVVSQLPDKHWDMNCVFTWLETVFLHMIVRINGTTIGLFLTKSYIDYDLARTIIANPVFESLHEHLGLDYHVTILLDPIISLYVDDLVYDVYLNLAEDKFIYMDMSQYDEYDTMLNADYDWLNEEFVETEEEDG